jgi:two-component system chemotaxis response regulator CheB
VPGHDIIVVGASAGGVEALTTLVQGLPEDLPAALFIVLHIPAQATSALPVILERAGTCPAAHAVNGEPIWQGHIYVAPPDLHLLIERGRVRLLRGPKENRSRPAVDPLFRSAARAYGPRVVGVILTGALNDGTAGLLAIKRRGGIAVVQDPSDAFFPSMPASALEYVKVDHCLPLARIPTLLTRLAREPAEPESYYPIPEDMKMETNIQEMDESALESGPRPGKISAFTCPECKGPLWEVRDGELLRFRCRVGHAFTAESMLDGQSEAVEEALWAALNILQESSQMSRRMADEARLRNRQYAAAHFEQMAREKMERISTLRNVLLNGKNEIPPNKAASDDQEKDALPPIPAEEEPAGD